VGWIDHAVGVVLAQWVTFERGPKGTKVHTWGDIVHSGVTIGGRKSGTPGDGVYGDVVRKLPVDVRPIGGGMGHGGLGVILGQTLRDADVFVSPGKSRRDWYSFPAFLR
jgi:hypothetical protein